jgi:hypothetical protein
MQYQNQPQPSLTNTLSPQRSCPAPITGNSDASSPPTFSPATVAQGKDLWSRAYEKLEQKDKEIIEELMPSAGTLGTPFVDDLIKLTGMKKEACEKKQWKFASMDELLFSATWQRKLSGASKCLKKLETSP